MDGGKGKRKWKNKMDGEKEKRKWKENTVLERSGTMEQRQRFLELH